MEFGITIGIYDTEMSGSFLGDFCLSGQIAYIYKAPMQNLNTKKMCFVR